MARDVPGVTVDEHPPEGPAEAFRCLTGLEIAALTTVALPAVVGVVGWLMKNRRKGHIVIDEERPDGGRKSIEIAIDESTTPDTVAKVMKVLSEAFGFSMET